MGLPFIFEDLRDPVEGFFPAELNLGASIRCLLVSGIGTNGLGYLIKN